METIYCEIEILTSVHIGDGTDIFPADVYFNKDKSELIYYNTNLLSSLLLNENENKFNEFIQICDNKNIDINTYWKKISEKIKECEISKIGLNSEVFKKYQTIKKISECPIATQEKNSLTNLPYIAGSSIKGALRTALEGDFLKRNEYLYNNKNIQNDPFNMLIVSDFILAEIPFNIYPTTVDKLYNVKRKEDNNDKMTVFCETLTKNTKFIGSISIKRKLLAYLNEETSREKLKLNFPEDVTSFLLLLNKRNKNLIQREDKEFSDNRGILNNSQIMKLKNTYKNLINRSNNNDCLIKLGKHGGALSKTAAGGDDNLSKFVEIKITQYNKILECQTTVWTNSEGEPMGWAKIKILEHKEYQERLKKAKEIENNILNNIEQKKQLIHEKEKIRLNIEKEKKVAEEIKLKDLENKANLLKNMTKLEKLKYDLFDAENINEQQKESKIGEFWKILDKMTADDKLFFCNFLKEYYEKHQKWKTKDCSSTQKEKVKKIKEILGVI